MSSLARAAAIVVALATVTPSASAERLGIGRVPSPAEIAGWDIDARPDGHGLPRGQGTVAQGLKLYDSLCASCHGDFGEAVGRNPELAGGIGSLTGPDPRRTIGSYWPYAATLFDYLRRAMPFGDAQSLEIDELYALTAYTLFLNDLLPTDGRLDQDSIHRLKMPNADGFVSPDPRPEFPPKAPCMTNCTSEIRIHSRARTSDGAGGQAR